MISSSVMRRLRLPGVFMLVMLAIELLDELLYSSIDAALPLIRHDLHLSYAQIGLLLSIPTFVSVFIEPVFGILSNMGKRKLLVVGGGVVVTLTVIGTASSMAFLPFLICELFSYPANGAFVSLAQSALMDSDPARHEQNMARWTFAGSVGWVVGSLGLSLAITIGLGWRGLFLAIAVMAAVLTLMASRQRFPHVRENEDGEPEHMTFREAVKDALDAARSLPIVRWYVLLVFADLMLDVLFGYLALYLVDAVGLSASQAALMIAVWTVVGLIGDFLIIPLLERIRGLTYLRVSAVINLILYPLFLLVPSIPLKIALIAVLGFFNSGWYSILQAQLYTALAGRSGTEMTLGAVFNALNGVAPLLIGVAAGSFGIGAAMWLLLLGPVALIVGLPKRSAA